MCSTCHALLAYMSAWTSAQAADACLLSRVFAHDLKACQPLACDHAPQACKVGKLFAKHFKVEEQQADLAKRRLAVAVGTPNRLTKLADLGALRLDRLRLIAVDVHLDAKQRCKRCRPDEVLHCPCVLLRAQLTPMVLYGSKRLLPHSAG